jgi:hypothetical protein
MRTYSAEPTRHQRYTLQYIGEVFMSVAYACPRGAPMLGNAAWK